MIRKQLRNALAVTAICIALVSTSRAQSYGTAADSSAIRAIVADLDSAWAHSDADRWASHYAADADFINILGMYFPDAQTMHERHRQIMTGVFKGSTHKGAIKRLRFLDSVVAIADVEIAVTGYTALPPGAQSTEPGILRTRMRHVFRKTDDAWQIVATQNTAVAPVQQK